MTTKPAKLLSFYPGVDTQGGIAARLAHPAAIVGHPAERDFAGAPHRRQETHALQVLRRLLRLAVEWGKVDKAPPRISLLPGEPRRERVLTPFEEAAHLRAAQTIGDDILASYGRALRGICATERGEQPVRPEDPYLLRDVSTVLLDCGLRPEECCRLR